jgi:hypothetical protein
LEFYLNKPEEFLPRYKDIEETKVNEGSQIANMIVPGGQRKSEIEIYVEKEKKKRENFIKELREKTYASPL